MSGIFLISAQNMTKDKRIDHEDSSSTYLDNKHLLRTHISRKEEKVVVFGALDKLD